MRFPPVWTAAAVGALGLSAACLDTDGLAGLDPGSTSSAGPGSGSSGEGSTTGSTGPTAPSAAQLYAQARCAAAAACDCSIETFPSPAECEVSMEARFLAWQDLYGDAGFFDAGCFEEVLAFYEMGTCPTHQDVALDSLAPTCLLYAGSRLLEESCVAGGGTAVHGELCAEGLACLPTIDGYQCHPPRNYDALTPGLGETCAIDEQIRAVCDPGLYCQLDPDGVCRQRVPLGDPCADLNSCEAGTFCDQSDPRQTICMQKNPPGTPCISSRECAPTDCEAGACTRPLCHDGACRVDIPQVCFLSDL